MSKISYRLSHFFHISKRGWSIERKKILSDFFELITELLINEDEAKRTFPEAEKSLKSFFKKRGGPQSSLPILFFNYHYHNYILRVATFKEKSMQLVNCFLSLGLPIEKVNESLILGMSQVKKKTKVYKLLNEIINDDILKENITQANEFKHRISQPKGKTYNEFIASKIYFLSSQSKTETIKQLKQKKRDLHKGIRRIKKYSDRLFYFLHS
ncbi:MAG: Cthe_2314 family HEPN domain-containing protein [Patescibacteria group bacterium]|jgi:hypothetical protein